MSDNVLLLAISDMMDKKLDPIKNDIRDIRLDNENTIKPNIQLLAENYIPAARRFEQTSNKIEIDTCKKNCRNSTKEALETL